MNIEAFVVLASIVGGTFVIVVCVAYLYYVRIWFRAYTVNSPVSFMRLFSLTSRRLSAYRLVSSFARAKEEGVELTLNDLEAHYAAGADPRRIADLLIDAHRSGRSLTVEEASERAGTIDRNAVPALNQEG